MIVTCWSIAWILDTCLRRALSHQVFRATLAFGFLADRDLCVLTLSLI